MHPTLAADGQLDDLVVAARAGGGWAFGRIWQSLAPKVCGYVRARGAQDPEDLTSEVFLQAFRGLPAFDGDGAAFKRWLFTIAHHRLVDDLRVRARRLEDVGLPPEHEPGPAPSAEEAALGHLLPEHLHALVAALTPDQREVLLLRALGDLSVEEMAVVTGRSETATRSLLRRAAERSRDLCGRLEGRDATAPGASATAGAR